MRCALWVLLLCMASRAFAMERCVQPDAWVRPHDRAVIDQSVVLASISDANVVLLGERHDAASHHDWQLQMLQGLLARGVPMVLALEMFPRRVQGVLDQWSAGRLNETEFLARSEWHAVWGMPPALYMPLFRFARDHGLPMVALNVDRSLVRRVSRAGLATVPVEEREGLRAPADPTPEYVERLRAVYAEHASAPDEARFARFVEAQQVWDAAMAQAIGDALRAYPDRTIVGILGSGHVRHGEGVPAQLRAEEVANFRTLIPWGPHDDCGELRPGYADFVFGTPQ